LALDESNKDNEEVTEIDGVKFIIERTQTTYFEKATLQFTKNMFGHKEFSITHR